jgi:DNA replication protein DnaC
LRLPQELAKLDHFDLLILAALSYVRRDQAETSVLFELMSERRYELKTQHHRQRVLSMGTRCLSSPP